jgi:RNA polymerase sigma-70 factor (ECF subfamily)
MTGSGENSTAVNGEEHAFGQLFKDNFKNMYAYAYTLVKDESTAKELAQQVFVNLWQKKDKLPSPDILVRYLYTSIYNASLNHLSHLKVRAAYRRHYLHSSEKATPASEQLQQKEMEKKIAEAYHELPEKSRLIFQLSRYEGLKNAEIAHKLQVSEKAVEKHMTKALKIFRSKLKEYMPFIILFWTTW